MTTTTISRPDLAQDAAHARHQCQWARYRMEHAKSKKDRQWAAEDVEFWGNKAAFLQSWLNKEGA